jgi:hypothetical protein
VLTIFICPKAESTSSLAWQSCVKPGLLQKLQPVSSIHSHIPPNLTPRVLISWITLSSHLSLGLPVFLVPSGLVTNTILTDLLLSVHVICPAQLNLFIYIYFIISGSLNSLYNSRLYLFHHVPLSSTVPKMHLRTLLSNRPNDHSPALDSTQVSGAYVNTGVTSVMHISNAVFLEISFVFRCLLSP